MCPHNQATRRAAAAEVHPAYASERRGFDLLEVLGWDEEARRQAFARSALKRAKLSMMKRNALIAAGNVLREGECRELHARLVAIRDDGGEEEMVRATARVVLEAFDQGA